MGFLLPTTNLNWLTGEFTPDFWLNHKMAHVLTSGRYCITEAIPEVKESWAGRFGLWKLGVFRWLQWRFWKNVVIYLIANCMIIHAPHDIWLNVVNLMWWYTCFIFISNSLLAGVPWQAWSPAASASWFERLLLCTRWAWWHFASWPKKRWSPFVVLFGCFPFPPICISGPMYIFFQISWQLSNSILFQHVCMAFCFCQGSGLMNIQRPCSLLQRTGEELECPTSPWAWKWGRITIHLLGGGNSNIFLIFTPKIGEDEFHQFWRCAYIFSNGWRKTHRGSN